MEGKTQPYEVESSTTIYEVNQLIYQRWGIPPEVQLIIYGGILLEADKTLDDYNIQDNSTLAFVIRMRGD